MPRILISGGGTGGHIYPAIAIAQELRKEYPDCAIKFVGATGRMEMEKVPQNGFEIEGVWISGLHRKNIWKNALLPFKLLSSLTKVRSIIRKFQPDVVVGVGGYVSGPLLFMAGIQGVPTLIQEQNSYPGITNKRLGRRAKRICVAYPGLEKFFDRDKLVLTGNPVRDFSHIDTISKAEAASAFHLKENVPTLLVTGGSLGARTINESIQASLENLLEHNIQIIWQTGSYYYESIRKDIADKYANTLVIRPFIDRMDLAYRLADVVVSRAGAISISELALAGKPVILVPSPNVSEDHQNKNAAVLADQRAAIVIHDAEAREKLSEAILMLISDLSTKDILSSNIRKFASPAAAKRIVSEITQISNLG